MTDDGGRLPAADGASKDDPALTSWLRVRSHCSRAGAHPVLLLYARRLLPSACLWQYGAAMLRDDAADDIPPRPAAGRHAGPVAVAWSRSQHADGAQQHVGADAAAGGDGSGDGDGGARAGIADAWPGSGFALVDADFDAARDSGPAADCAWPVAPVMSRSADAPRRSRLQLEVHESTALLSGGTAGGTVAVSTSAGPGGTYCQSCVLQ